MKNYSVPNCHASIKAVIVVSEYGNMKSLSMVIYRMAEYQSCNSSFTIKKITVKQLQKKWRTAEETFASLFAPHCRIATDKLQRQFPLKGPQSWNRAKASDNLLCPHRTVESIRAASIMVVRKTYLLVREYMASQQELVGNIINKSSSPT